MTSVHHSVAVSTHDGHDGNRNTMPCVSLASDALQNKSYIAKRTASVKHVLRSPKSVKQMKSAHVKNKSNSRALDKAFPVELPSLMQLIASSYVSAVNSNPRMTYRRIVHGWW